MDSVEARDAASEADFVGPFLENREA